jgi:hypothetical protein
MSLAQDNATGTKIEYYIKAKPAYFSDHSAFFTDDHGLRHRKPDGAHQDTQGRPRPPQAAGVQLHQQVNRRLIETGDRLNGPLPTGAPIFTIVAPLSPSKSFSAPSYKNAGSTNPEPKAMRHTR